MTNVFRKYFVLFPILYLFVAIFFARSEVLYVYVVAATLLALTFTVTHRRKLIAETFLAYWMVTLAALGLSASVILSIEKIELLANPNRIASCSLSPIVACSPVISSPQSSAFGFPNSFIGIFGFTAVFVAAMTILAGATKLSKIWWRTLLSGIVFGAGFCTWLFHEGVYDIGKLCLYCMLVWLVSFALLWLVTAHSIQNRYINLGTKLNKLLSNKYKLIAATYLIIFILLFFRWSDYWMSLLW